MAPALWTLALLGASIGPAAAQGPVRAALVARVSAPPAAEVVPTPPAALPGPAQLPLDVDLSVWWDPQVVRPLRKNSEPLNLTLESVVVGTLMHSPQVRVISDFPIIRRAAIIEAQSAFDVRNFAESRYVGTSDPVGSTLTTGGAPRFIDQNWTNAMGLRRRTLTGAQFEASQRIGYEDNNSIFFVPTEQGTAKLSLSLTQPLLNGRGQAYNTSVIVLAEIDLKIARDQLSKELQTMLVEIHRGYWELYLERAALLQKRKLYQEAVTILDELDGRRGVDVTGSQIVRARAAVATRQGDTIRYAASVRNAEARLRALVNDPQLFSCPDGELIPAQPPSMIYCEVPLCDALITALKHRPEIHQAATQLQGASVRANVAKHELMPVLNMILGTYVSGLEGDSGIIPAFGDQFSEGRPTYSGGLLFDVPYGNRAAQARLQQRRVEVRQLANRLQAVSINVRAEVEIAVREITTTYREMISRRHAMAADQAEIDYLLDRWKLLPGDQQMAGIVLDDVLKAQERLADASLEFATAKVAYNLSLVNVKRVTGTLLDCEAITQMETCVDNLPTLLLDKALPSGVDEYANPYKNPSRVGPSVPLISSRIERLPKIK